MKSLGNFFTVRDLIDKGFPERLSGRVFIYTLPQTDGLDAG